MVEVECLLLSWHGHVHGVAVCKDGSPTSAMKDWYALIPDCRSPSICRCVVADSVDLRHGVAEGSSASFRSQQPARRCEFGSTRSRVQVPGSSHCIPDRTLLLTLPLSQQHDPEDGPKIPATNRRRAKRARSNKGGALRCTDGARPALNESTSTLLQVPASTNRALLRSTSWSIASCPLYSHMKENLSFQCSYPSRLSPPFAAAAFARFRGALKD